ncbi:dihydrodipicolinate synthase family protein [Amycolatopsis rhabdoformis]|uniref:Dihydrodipicolinate synthase family protein n=1 Tax=Amycolatopsis rhabdoformis TaxID=1448059 RepID=A0ABZ1I950_9PSEU|nr:dihydrodipicolinate synthase family protein [Amycolatopsis rhabdoformis]WSE30422.1 dihydrodipicolinate synthase family protein [Amycolatopsis rhabdoformis]
MTEYTPFRQLFITPVLPFLRDGSIDEAGYRALLRRFLTPEYLDAGVAIVANPEAGEIYTLDRAERSRVVEITLEEVAGRTPVLGGVAHVTTAGMVECAKDVAAAGVDGLFVLPPIGSADITLSWNADAYPEVFLDVLTAIADAVDLPQVIHPVGQFSARYGPGLSAEVTRQIIAAVPQVVGWKMTYNYDGFREIAGVLRSAGRPVGIYGAVGKYFHENLANDTLDGTSAGSFNFALERMVEHISAWRKGDYARATEIWRSGLSELQDYIFSDFGRLHIRYKAATWLRGFIDNPLMRPPVPAPRRHELADLTRLLRAADLTTRPDDEISALAGEFGLK